ncbi:hypothetical protein OXX69_004798 [Metschnikowia pulcherrima]
MSTFNNENDYRVTRSRTKDAVAEPAPAFFSANSSQNKPTEDVLVSHTHTDSKTAAKPASSAASVSSARNYLADVSRKFGIAKLTAPASKKRPLGGETAPLAQKTGDLPKSAKIVMSDPSSSPQSTEKEATMPSDSSAVPRMPQKRSATESSTDLVEKLHSTENEPLGKFKKSRKIDYEWQDLDEEDADDPLMASEYVTEIFPYLHMLEKKTLPNPEYLYTQSQLKPKMRSILVDWLVEMHERFRLLPETLFLAINIMDRFMSVEIVEIGRLQLLATGSLFIAAKYEEVFSPSVKNYAHFTADSYTEQDILEAEKYILTTLQFDLSYPNPMNFLRRISKADDYDVQSRTLGKYLLEISIVDHHFIGVLPSLCAAAAMYISRLILGKSPVWHGNLIHYSGGYKVDDMHDCVRLLVRYLSAPIEHDEFHKKYARGKFLRASQVCRKWAKEYVGAGRDLFDASLHTESLP